MGDALDALATGLFVAALVYVSTRWGGDGDGAGRAAALAFLAATPVNYLGRRLLGSAAAAEAEPSTA
ncbi:hypothetical protein [Halorarius litoreus]|uniref:hypothetical protein n=1 Tax=Halorarius litoreus TaxID=2962676 RepID=UPI0020CD3A56|nr:hypothetical protein [Halorarius litoreus]